MTNDVVNSIMSGYAAGLKGTVLDPVLTIGRTPVKDLPCEGTGGEVKGLSTVGLNIPGLLTVGAANAHVFGVQTGRRRARAWAEASIAERQPRSAARSSSRASRPVPTSVADRASWSGTPTAPRR